MRVLGAGRIHRLIACAAAGVLATSLAHAGTVTGHATATLSVAGSAPFTVQTDAVPPNSGDAVKVFQDANIQITPNGSSVVGAMRKTMGNG